jgi:hypothetical protein
MRRCGCAASATSRASSSSTSKPPALRQKTYPLIATIAEPTTVIVEHELPGGHRFDVTLAIVPRQNDRFPKGHGHLVRFRVAVED